MDSYKKVSVSSKTKTDQDNINSNKIVDIFADEYCNIDINVDSKELSYLILGSDELTKRAKGKKNQYDNGDTTPIAHLKDKLEKKLLKLLISTNHKSDLGIKIDKERNSSAVNSISNRKKRRHCYLYTERRHLKNVSKTVKKLYQLFKDNMIEMDRNFDIVPTLIYIGFKMARKSIVNVIVGKKKLVCYFNTKTINDSLNMVEKLPASIGGIGKYRINVTSEQSLSFVLTLVEQILLSEPELSVRKDVAA